MNRLVVSGLLLFAFLGSVGIMVMDSDLPGLLGGPPVHSAELTCRAGVVCRGAVAGTPTTVTIAGQRNLSSSELHQLEKGLADVALNVDQIKSTVVSVYRSLSPSTTVPVTDIQVQLDLSAGNQ